MRTDRGSNNNKRYIYYCDICNNQIVGNHFFISLKEKNKKSGKKILDICGICLKKGVVIRK